MFSFKPAAHLFKCLAVAVGAPLTAFVLVSAANAAESVWNRPEDVNAITAIEKGMADSRKAPGLSNLLAEQVVLVDPYSSEVRRGRSQVLRAYGEHKALLQGAKGQYKEISIVSTPNFACSASQIRYDVRRPGGGSSPTELRKLDVFKKVDGQWRLIQQHISAEMDRKLGKPTDAPLAVRGALTWQDSKFSETPVDPAAARRGITEWTEYALREVGLETAMTTISGEKNVLFYAEFSPGNLRTRKEVQAYWGPLYNSFKGLRVQSPLLEVDSDGLLGAEINTQNITIDMKDGTQPQISIRQSDCLRQFDGKWQTFLEAVSYPVDSKTGRMVPRSPETVPSE